MEDHSVFGGSVMIEGGGGRHESIQPLPLPDPLISSPERDGGRKRREREWGREKDRERKIECVVLYYIILIRFVCVCECVSV